MWGMSEMNTRSRPALLARAGVLGALAAAVLLSDCARPAQLVRMDGSAGVAPLVTALADAWRASGARDGVRIATGLGSSARAAALLDGRIDVAMASHGIDTAELARRGVAVHEIARTPVLFGVHAGIPVASVTGAQVCGILSGRLASWRELGGPDLPIVAAMRPREEVDAEVMLAALPCLREIVLAPAVRVVARPDSMAALLARTPGAFGLTSATFVNASAGRIRGLALDGVAPTAANVSAETAPSRSAYLLTTQSPPAAVRRFLAFVRGAEGRRVIEQSGGVPVP